MRIPSRTATAFTLIELMISIALVVILMVGITKVFSLTSQTAGATNQVSSALRDSRATQSQLSQDFSSAVTDGSPCMILRSLTRAQFRNKADEQSDRDGNPLTVDLDGDNQEGTSAGETFPYTTYNYRNHRLDIVSFFTRQRQRRQTGGDDKLNVGPLINLMTADEAWVWYGHLWLPGNNAANPWPAPDGTTSAQYPLGTPSVTFPGESTINGNAGATIATNPNNYYATQWILGRVAILLAQPDIFTNQIKNAPRFYVTDTTGGPVNGFPMSPLQAGSYDVDKTTFPLNPGNRSAELQDSRYDVAGTTIDAYRRQLEATITQAPFIGAGAKPWWDRIMCYDCISLPPPVGGGLTGGRFQANPFFNPPITPKSLAKQSPIFLPACTQFMVEYAGDFLAQDADPTHVSTYGQVTNYYLQVDPATAPATDGQIDFVVTTDPSTGIKSKQIRWYGLPRDTDGTPGITGSGKNVDATQMTDVVPLVDVIRSGGKSTVATTIMPQTLKDAMALVKSAPFERVVPSAQSDYSTIGSPIEYTCAWGPDPSIDRMPKMIRITLTIDDPNGKLTEGKTFEYVFSLP